MKRNHWILLAGLAIILIGGGYGISTWIKKPMGQPLALQAPTQVSPTATEVKITQPTLQVQKTSTVIPISPTATLTSQPTEMVGVCGKTGTMRLLVVGLTTPTAGEILGADAIRLVTINYDQPSVKMLALSSLLWVDTPVLADLGVKQGQLTTVYLKAYEAATGIPEPDRHQKAIQALAQTIVDNFGYLPDHYITGDEGAFIKYVDAIGGAEIELPKAIDGTMEGFGFYPAGLQVLDGTRALNFARLFHPNGQISEDVWGNLARQNEVLKGILDATIDPKNWVKIPGLAIEVKQAVNTDLSIDQLLILACMAKEAGENTRMEGVSKEMVTQDPLGHLLPDKQAVQQLIKTMDSTEQ